MRAQVDSDCRFLLSQLRGNGGQSSWDWQSDYAFAVHIGSEWEETIEHALRSSSPAPLVIGVWHSCWRTPVTQRRLDALRKLVKQGKARAFCPIKSSHWLPQRRDRLIIIGTRKPFTVRPPENTRPVTLKSILEADPDVTRPKAIQTRMTGGYRDRPIISDPANNDIAPTCVAHYAKDKSTRLVKDKRYPLGVRPYSVREFARLQGVPDWFQFPVSSTAAYRQIGNGVSVPVGNWIGNELRRYFGRQTSQAA